MTRKYDYSHVLQGNYGQGWEDLSAYESDREARSDLKEYRVAEPEFSHRIVQRRVKRDAS